MGGKGDRGCVSSQCGGGECVFADKSQFCFKAIVSMLNQNPLRVYLGQSSKPLPSKT